jgi:hypothetical protein
MLLPGLNEKREPTFGNEVVPSASLGAWLRNAFTHHDMDSTSGTTTIWLDVVGYDAATFKELATVLEVDEDMLSKALLFK